MTGASARSAGSGAPPYLARGARLAALIPSLVYGPRLVQGHMAVEIRLLGRVDALVDGQALSLGGSKRRAVLAILALRANRTVGADDLIDGLWGERPPQSAAKNVQYHVSQLRKAFASDDSGARIVTHGRGYELKLPEDAVDAVCFERRVERARRESEQGIADGAARGALELWQGAPLADVASEPFAGTEIRRLEALHLRAIELAIDAELAAGRHAEAIGGLEALIREHPAHERFHAQRMLALYWAGRQSEAVEGYRAAHRTLAEELGVEPGTELRELQEAILREDPSLDPRPPQRELPRQLEGGSPLIAGRDREIRWLRKRWQEAEAGPRVALVSGPGGIGKSRLAAELAAEVQRSAAAVVYAAGSGAPDAALEVIRGAQDSERPTLLVLDDADDASPALLEAAAVLAEKPRDSALLLLVLHRDEQGPPAFTGTEQRLALRPLRVEAAAEIAELYAPADGVAMPIETLMADSEGVPLRVHRAASGWAQAHAAERLEAAADTAAVDQGGLRTARARVAGGVTDLQLARERTHLYVVEEPIDPSAPDVCPFRGLAPFDSAHAEYFFGRERLVADLVARLVGSTLIAIVGPSGGGKSSALRAGLLPSLADGVLPGSERWRQVAMRPGEHPVAELGRALARVAPEASQGNGDGPLAAALDSLGPDERLVLAVDQLEEIFTACRDEAERAAFAGALAALAADADQRAVVVLGIRGDFYGRCAAYHQLSAQLSANNVLVGPMRREELRRAIELPAKRAGLLVESSLVSALVGDVAEEPGGLPLLSTTLVELWEERSGRTLHEASYQASGGVSGAVARLAERAYMRLSESQRERARAILLRLSDADEAAPVRRRVPLAELETERDEDAAAALAVLTESRIVTVDEGTVEVAHEALLSEWPRLRAWLADDAEGRRLHQHLIHAAAEWQASGRDPAELYRGARLASALEWASDHEREPNELERAFLAESRAASEREAERQRRTNRRLRALLAGVGVLLAAAVVAGVIAISERQGASSAATTADARRLAAQAVSEERRDQALRLATAGVALDDSPATRSSLLSALVRGGPSELGVINADDKIYSAALSPDGRTLATDNGTFFDTQTRERIGEYSAHGWLGFDPRGGSLALVGGEKFGHLHVIDAATQRRRTSARLGGYPADPGTPIWLTATYAPDGRSVIVQYARWSGPAAEAHVFVRRFDPRTGSPIGPAVRVAARWNQPRPSPPSMTQDGRLFIAEDEVKRAATYAIDADTLGVVRRYPIGAFTTAVSPDGATLALGQTDGRVRLLDTASGRVRTPTGGRPDGRLHRSKIPGHGRAIWAAAFSPDGRTLATGDGQGNVIVWDVSEGRAIETLEGHDDAITFLAFGPDGRTLYTTSADSTARIWDVAGYRRLARPFRTNTVNDPGASSPRAFALSPDGRTLAAARRDGRVDLIDAETRRRTGGFEAFAGRAALAIEYSPDGSRLAVAGQGGGVGLWDAGSGKRVGPLLSAPRGPRNRNTHNVRALAFGRGGLLAAAEVGGLGKGTKGAVRIWEIDERSLIRRPLHLDQVRGLAFSPDGSRLAIPFGARTSAGGTGAGDPDGVEILDVRNGETLATLRADEVGSVAFSPDGRLLAGGELDGDLLLWATDGWGRVAALPSGGDAPSVAFSPDGRTLAASDRNGAVALWDVASQQAVGPPLPGLPDARTTARFTPDGARLFAVSETGRAIRWEVDPELWLQRACALAGGGLTPEQWERVVPEQDYVSACPSD
jgi:WD40 repeat protein/DNA-binding SARP family transcriptional activator